MNRSSSSPVGTAVPTLAGRRTPERVRRAGVTAVVAALALGLGASSASAAFTARVIKGHGVSYVNVRSGPSTAGPVLWTIGAGAAVSLDCYSHGQAVTGPYGSSTIWYRLSGSSGWVTDSLLETGSNSAVTGPCSTSGRAWGQTTSTNTGIWDQCTWGAKEKFREYSGVYPNITGNARQWFDSARANGWTTVLDAQAYSIVVFQPGVHGADPTYGHVGWVDAVERRSDGLYVHVVEMNYAGQGHRWHDRWVKDVVGMSFILAPR